MNNNQILGQRRCPKCGRICPTNLSKCFCEMDLKSFVTEKERPWPVRAGQTRELYVRLEINEIHPSIALDDMEYAEIIKSAFEKNRENLLVSISVETTKTDEPRHDNTGNYNPNRCRHWDGPATNKCAKCGLCPYDKACQSQWCAIYEPIQV